MRSNSLEAVHQRPLRVIRAQALAARDGSHKRDGLKKKSSLKTVRHRCYGCVCVGHIDRGRCSRGGKATKQVAFADGAGEKFDAEF